MTATAVEIPTGVKWCGQFGVHREHEWDEPDPTPEDARQRSLWICFGSIATVPAQKVRQDDLHELACKAHPGVWAEAKRGFTNAPLHWEWYDWMLLAQRLAVVAPREHAKSECFTVNQLAWRCVYTPGIWCYVFAQTGDQAVKIKERIDTAVLEVAPWMIDNARKMSSVQSTYANFSQVTCAGAGKGVRGAHPDIIVGDDVLSDDGTGTSYQRKKTETWWFGTIGGMAHPGTTRALGPGHRVEMAPTKVFLVGTPFHASDLLLGMRENPLYRFRRYAAEFRPTDLVDGLAVEVA